MTIYYSHMPAALNFGIVRQVDMAMALKGLEALHLMGFYNEAAYYGIKMWIDAFMTMESGPMPSGVWFSSPATSEPVVFVRLCADLEQEWISMERGDTGMSGNALLDAIREEDSVNTFELSDNGTVTTASLTDFDEDPMYNLEDDDSVYDFDDFIIGSPRSVMDFEQ